MSFAEAILEGNRLALARTLTQVENDSRLGRETLNDLYPHTGKAHLIGVTGAPGTGKSSLVNQLARFYRQPPDGFPRLVAIVAVDPSSPFSGGALLGDRVRMRDLAGDPGVFIRSMASRGSLGGLATTTSGVVQVMDAAGFEVILVETVGAGQAEVDIARLAHTTIVVEAPGLGDDIQAIKAGILEIADILVVNKADRPGVELTERALKSMLQLSTPVTHGFHNGGIEKSGHEMEQGIRDHQARLGRGNVRHEIMHKGLFVQVKRTLPIDEQAVSQIARVNLHCITDRAKAIRRVTGSAFLFDEEDRPKVFGVWRLPTAETFTACKCNRH